MMESMSMRNPVRPTWPVAALVAAGCAAPLPADLARGEVLRVDAADRAILIRHGDIPALAMGPMTMEFVLQDVALASGLKAGDVVLFRAVRQGDDYVITRLRKAP
jgi:Cu(I)/Ag(I) efflux system membrane protein CusA/SilA